jgi:hypothetical protein
MSSGSVRVRIRSHSWFSECFVIYLDVRTLVCSRVEFQSLVFNVQGGFRLGADAPSSYPIEKGERESMSGATICNPDLLWS